MKIKNTKVFAIWLLSLLMITGAQIKKKQQDKAPSNEITLEEVRAYRFMHRVNKKPIDMLEETKLMCAPPNFKYGPHYNPGLVYYINEIAAQGIKTFADQKQFPVGAMIVKEKQERRMEESAQIITVMKKIKAGRGEDTWSYKMYDAKRWKELKVEEQKDAPASKNCLGCHRQYKEYDYISTEGIALLLKH